MLTKITHLFGVLHVPPSLLAARVTTVMMAGPSLSGSRGAEPSSKMARPWSFLWVSSRYVHDVVHRFIPLHFSCSCSELKGDAWVA
jgi:nitroreductase